MDEARRALVRVAAAMSPCSTADLRSALRDAVGVADPVEVEEVLLQSYLLAGFPAALNGFRLWRETSGRVASVVVPDDPAAWHGRGPDVFRRVYGSASDRVIENMAALHPDLGRWALEEGYGKVLSRPGLDLATRELCLAALLASLDAEPQLHAHLRGALNAGASEEDVEDALREAALGMTPERARAAREVWGRVLDRRRQRS